MRIVLLMMFFSIHGDECHCVACTTPVSLTIFMCASLVSYEGENVDEIGA